MAQLQKTCRNRVQDYLRLNKIGKNEQWSESVAVGSEAFIMNTMEKIGIKAEDRETVPMF